MGREYYHGQRALYLSVALTSAEVIPGSLAECPASSIIQSSASGQRCTSETQRHSFTHGIHR